MAKCKRSPEGTKKHGKNVQPSFPTLTTYLSSTWVSTCHPGLADWTQPRSPAEPGGARRASSKIRRLHLETQPRTDSVSLAIHPALFGRLTAYSSIDLSIYLFILSYSIPFYSTLFYPIAFYSTLFYPILSYPILSIHQLSVSLLIIGH